MAWGLISGIGKAIASTTSKVVETAKKVVSEMTNTAKKVTDVVVNLPTVGKAVDNITKVVDAAKKAVASTVGNVAAGLTSLVAANRVEDSSLRNEATKKAADSLAELTNKVADVSKTIGKATETVTKATESVIETAKKVTEEAAKTIANLWPQLDDIEKKGYEAINTLPEGSRAICREIWKDLIEGLKAKDRERVLRALRRGFRTEVTGSPGLLAIPAILAAMKAAGYIIAAAGVIKLIIDFLGIPAFTSFIYEEAIQMAGFGVYAAWAAKDPTAAKAALKTYDDLVSQAESWVESWGRISFWVYPSYKAYVQAAKSYSKTMHLLIDRKLYILKVISEGEHKEFWKESMKALAEGKPIPENPLKMLFEGTLKLPEEMESELRNKERDINEALRMLRDYKYDKRWDQVKKMIAEASRLLDDYEAWVDARKETLSYFDRYEGIKSWIASQKAILESEKDFISKMSAPTAYILIVCSHKPDRLFVDEVPIEAFTTTKVEVQPGKHLIRAEKEGYHADAVTVEALPDKTVEARIEFVKKPQEYGFLTVKSTPEAFLYVGINPTPLKTPLIKHPLPPGRYDLKLRLMGYRDEEFSVTILPGTETVVEKILVAEKPERPGKGRIFVDTSPGQAWVFVDGIIHPYPTDTVIEVDPGLHKVRIEKSGYKTYETEVVVEEGKTVEIRHKLEPLPEKRSWRVVVTSEPSGALVLLDHIPTGKRTPTTLSLGPGTWTIGVQLEGYYPAEQTITLG